MTRRDTGFSPEVKQVVLARSGGHCEVMRLGCRMDTTEIHHRVNRGMGGAEPSGDASAALAVCRPCHDWLGKHPRQAYELGFLVHRNRVTVPAEVPVRWRCRSWVLLSADGDRQVVAWEAS